MKYLILAAGRSKRFGRNKLEERFGDKTLPQLAAEFALTNGATEIFLTVSRNSVSTDGSRIFHQIVDDVKEICDPKIIFQDENSYGPGAAITAWSGIIADPFIVLFGDNFYRGEIKLLDIFSDPNDKNTYFTTQNKEFNPRNLQLAAVKRNCIIEKPHGYVEGKYFCGLVRFPAHCFDKFSSLQKSARGEIEVADMVNLGGESSRAIDLDELNVEWDDLTYEADLDRMRDRVNGTLRK